MLEKFKTISNPLTIIALFAGIAEISGTVVLPLLKEEVQQVYVWFLMVFPCLLVLAFFVTLNLNYKALYAPSDFQNEENFLGLLNQSIEKAELSMENALENAMEAQSLIKEASSLLAKEKYESANEFYRNALRINSNSIDAKIGIALCISYIDEEDYKTPLALLQKIHEEHPNSAKALYNCACIKAANKTQFEMNEILNDLGRAFEINRGHVELCSSDPDFDEIRYDPEFVSLIEKNKTKLANEKSNSTTEALLVLRAKK